MDQLGKIATWMDCLIVVVIAAALLIKVIA